MKYNSYNKHLYIRPEIKDLENGFNYKFPRKNAKVNCAPKEDTMSSLGTDNAC